EMMIERGISYMRAKGIGSRAAKDVRGANAMAPGSSSGRPTVISEGLSAVYLRSDADLSSDEMRDLEHYLDMLRLYYGIPADQPVFPPIPQASTRRARPSRTAINRPDHPWRQL